MGPTTTLTVTSLPPDMPEPNASDPGVKRELSQLLSLHRRLQQHLEDARSDVLSPGAKELAGAVRSAMGNDALFEEILEILEKGLRRLKASEERVRNALSDDPPEVPAHEFAHLPPHFQEFLAARVDQQGFTFDLVQDEVRGWIIRWKEYTPEGTVRGYGQYCERPYAWLADSG